MKPQKYPVPLRSRWSVLIEFDNAIQVSGTSATDLLARLGTVQWLADWKPVPEMKRLLAHRVEVLTNVVLDPTMDDDDFLDAAAAAGAFRLVRR
jgi:hypothetical protein